MKLTIKCLLLGLLSMFFLTGCYTTNGPYTPEYVNGVLKNNLGEINKTIIVKKHPKKIIKKHPTTLRAKLGGIKVHMSSIGDNITVDFFEQYFKDVVLTDSPEKEKGLFYVDFEILDYEHFHGAFSDSATVTIITKISVEKKGQIILSKSYKEILSSDAVLNVNIFNHDIDTIAIETIHKAVLNVFETQIKPDLLKALKENI